MPETIAWTPDDIPARSLDARTRSVQGRVFVASSSQALELSETAAVIWKKISGKHTIREIAAAIAEEYDTDEGTVITDTTEVIATLDAEGLVSRRE